MKRGYKYEKEMLHWLDGGDIEQKYSFLEDGWEPFNGEWTAEQDMEYRIAESADKPKEERWLYVYSTPNGEAFSRASPCHIGTVSPHLMGCESIGKIRLEDV